jgi:transcriptional regulator with XRE-family HTH domain
MLTEAKILGGRLRQLRLAREWTQEQLAEAAGITSTYISDLERGEKVPSLSILLRLARGLDIPLAELLQDFTRDAVRRMSVR